jgi:hypothetical protein
LARACSWADESELSLSLKISHGLKTLFRALSFGASGMLLVDGPAATSWVMEYANFKHYQHLSTPL